MKSKIQTTQNRGQFLHLPFGGAIQGSVLPGPICPDWWRCSTGSYPVLDEYGRYTYSTSFTSNN